MGASVYWRPIKGGKDFGDGISRGSLEKVFGPFPLRLSAEHVGGLEVMVRLDVSGRKDEWEQLIEAIDKHGEIEIWAEY